MNAKGRAVAGVLPAFLLAAAWSGLAGSGHAALPAAGLQQEPPRYRPIWIRTGPSADSWFTYDGMASIGDLDRDGVRDLAVSRALPVQELWILSGRDGNLLRKVMLRLPGLRALADAHDLDGDGAPDVLAYFGASQVVQALSAADDRILFLARSPYLPVPVHFGWAMASLDDMTRDGWRDVAIASPFSDPPGAPPGVRGDVQLYEGSSGRLLRTLWHPEAYPLGASLAVARDLTGDGINDLVAGAPGTCRTPGPAVQCANVDLGAGMVVAFSGATGRRLWEVRGLDGEDGLGMSVAVVEDIDGDGVPDVVVGTDPWQSSFLRPPRPGYVMVLSGRTGRVLQVLRGAYNAGGFGSVVAAVGDVDGDGYADFAVSAPGAPRIGGQQHGFGRVYIYSGRDFTPILVMDSDQGDPPDGFAYKIAGMGRVDDDDVPDLAVGQVGWRNERRRGAVLMLSLAPEGVDAFGRPCHAPDALPSPARIATRGSARRGETLPVHVFEVPPGRTSFLVVGSSDRSFGGVPLPLDLAGLGLAGCSLYVAPDVVLASPVGPRGSAPHRLAIPAEPSLAQRAFFLQGGVLDAAAPGAPPALTRALRVTVQ